MRRRIAAVALAVLALAGCNDEPTYDEMRALTAETIEAATDMPSALGFVDAVCAGDVRGAARLYIEGTGGGSEQEFMSALKIVRTNVCGVAR
jgi:hypothetical protein